MRSRMRRMAATGRQRSSIDGDLGSGACGQLVWRQIVGNGDVDCRDAGRLCAVLRVDQRACRLQLSLRNSVDQGFDLAPEHASGNGVKSNFRLRPASQALDDGLRKRSGENPVVAVDEGVQSLTARPRALSAIVPEALG